MAAAIWIVRKLVSNKVDIVDGIETVMINDDDLDSEATVLADTHAAVIVAGHQIPPSGYFDTAVLALAAGQLDTDEDMIMMGKRLEVIA